MRCCRRDLAVLSSPTPEQLGWDGRTYDYVVAVRAVSSSDGMTADWVRVHETLAVISNRLLAEVEHVGRGGLRYQSQAAWDN